MKNKNMIGNTKEGFKAKVFAMREEVTIDKKDLMIEEMAVKFKALLVLEMLKGGSE